MSLFYVLLLGFAVSIDGFIAGIAYGLKNIRIPPTSLAVVGIISGLFTIIAMLCASLLENIIDAQTAIIIGSFLLILIGLFNIFQEYINKYFVCYDANEEITVRKLTFSMGQLVISIMGKPEAADIDNSKVISPLEAIFLGIALGVDNMVATFAAALMGFLPIYTPLVMGMIQVIVIYVGIYTSKHLISENLKKQFPYLPGIVLILLGIIRLR